MRPSCQKSEADWLHRLTFQPCGQDDESEAPDAYAAHLVQATIDGPSKQAVSGILWQPLYINKIA